MKLFDKIPDNFFSPLSKRSRTVYAFCLLTLYEQLLLYKTDIKKSDYVLALKNQGAELLELYNIQADLHDAEVDDIDLSEEDRNNVSKKISVIIKRLNDCGWFSIIKDPKTQVEKLYLPVYSIQMLEFISRMTSDVNFYLPLVHQTYSELKLENEKEDDQMYRTLCNALHNVNELELSVTTLRHAIKVYGTNLTTITNPNEALIQHFDKYQVDIGDNLYHPMKTYDSLGLYTQPIITILRSWSRNSRILSKLTGQAKLEPRNSKVDSTELTNNITHMIQDIIEKITALNLEFDDIDKDNSEYTEAVQRKVNHLAGGDKTIVGKLESIITKMSIALNKAIGVPFENVELLHEVGETICVNSAGFIDSDSLTLPYERFPSEPSELMPIDLGDPDFDFEEMLTKMQEDVDLFSDDSIKEFYLKNFGNKKEITTTDFTIENLNELILYIYGIVKAAFGNYYFDIEKVEDSIVFAGYFMPKYKFYRKDTLK